MRYFTLLFLMVFGCSGPKEDPISELNLGLAAYVDPMIGTAEHGHVYPGATVPFGAVQLSPDNGLQGWDWCSGYNYIDSMIVGFSHTHLSGTGIGDLCDVLVMPAAVEVDLSKELGSIREEDFASMFSHENEKAQPGYYAVDLDNGIKVELTATARTGLHRYTFPESSDHEVVIDLGHAINWDRPVETLLKKVSPTDLVGHRHSTGWAKDQRLFFAMEFSEPIESIWFYDSTEVHAGDALQGTKVRSRIKFAADPDVILLKVGISSASLEGAQKALETELPDWDFGAIRKQALVNWNLELDKIRIESKNEDWKKTFYTSLYHACLAPVLFSDAMGYNKSVDGKIVQQDQGKRYDIFSLWDTFRAAHPLYTITQPDKINDFIRSMLAHYQEYGLLPVWSLLGNETNTMTGYHAMPVILDAFIKGYRDYDVELAFEAMKASAMQDIRGTKFYRDYGYIPHDLEGQSVTKTLEYAFDDWCIAQMALLLEYEEDYQYFIKRSKSYQPLFDPSTGFMRAKLQNGRWKTPFDPQYSSHDFSVAEYTEGNAWQHSWFVPHDVADLKTLMGGDEQFVVMLDSLFAMDSEVTGDFVSADISGLIGQYAHGNEPSHHIAYLYNYAGVPWKTQERVREIMASQYNNTPAGLCGNEDCGQMSAWYVWSAMGLYPVNPASGVYVIGSPLINRTVIDVGEGKSFVIKALYANEENKYIQSATLNEDPLTRSYVHHYEIMDGGELILEMGPQPNYLHWSDPEAFPPSESDENLKGF